MTAAASHSGGGEGRRRATGRRSRRSRWREARPTTKNPKASASVVTVVGVVGTYGRICVGGGISCNRGKRVPHYTRYTYYKELREDNPCASIKRSPERARERFFTDYELAGIGSALADGRGTMAARFIVLVLTNSLYRREDLGLLDRC
jgi:hypothetical protein